MQRFETITKAEQALNHLRRRILTGELAPGSKVPAERTLCREYALSRVTVNKITSALVQEGMLERLGPKGTFVVGGNGRNATRKIGFLMQTMAPQEVNPVLEAIFRAFADASHAHPVLVSFGMVGRWGEHVPAGFGAGELDALVVAGAAPEAFLETFRRGNRPILFVDETEGSDPAHLVTTDQSEAGRLAAGHLLARGRRAILALTFTKGSYRGFDLRLEGYRKAHAEAGVPVDERLIQHAWMSRPEHIVDLLRRLESDGVACDGFFGLADLVALWGLEALQRLNRRVPEDVSVIGVDGLDVGAWARPQLTTVVQPTRAIGRRAFERVHAWLSTGRDDAGTERLKPELLERAST